MDPRLSREWLGEVLARLAPTYQGEISDDTPLSEGGLRLDSLGLTDLVQEIERALAITVPDEMISPDHFGTVGHLLRLLRSLVGTGTS